MSPGRKKEQKLLETGILKQLQHLHDELESLQGKVPTLDGLAQQYGISARVLNDEFRKVYGCSIFTCISELRLKEAHEALLKTDIPMKTLAINLGYCHVNHVIGAFGRKFGYSPGSLRKKGKQAPIVDSSPLTGLADLKLTTEQHYA